MDWKTEIEQWRELLRWEEQEQEDRWMDKGLSYRELRRDGILLYPIQIQKKDFSLNGSPRIVAISSALEEMNTHYFSVGSAVALFYEEGDEMIQGKIVQITGKKVEVVLHASEFPEWITHRKLGIRRLPDVRTFKILHGILSTLEMQKDKHLVSLYKYIHQIKEHQPDEGSSSHQNNDLNTAQNNAVENGLSPVPVQVIHGPPGTGKTTTLVALIKELTQQDKRIIASASGNAAVDHLANQLLKKGISIFRLGNSAKMNEEIWKYSPEGVLSKAENREKIKNLHIEANKQLKKAQNFRRSFGEEERRERKQAYNELKLIRKEINQTINYCIEKEIAKADVVLGTPIGLQDKSINEMTFDVGIIDEAGQCIEPLAWLIMEKSKRIILAGDHHQLPPTVISPKAAKEGLSKSILEMAIDNNCPTCFLDTQYRMPPEIANFSSLSFYHNKLLSVPPSQPNSFLFYDTAGAGFEEKREDENSSIYNLEELNFVVEQYKNWSKKGKNVVYISPYSKQTFLAKEELRDIVVSTIDSFQGQEADVVILSMVRSNKNRKIGFLSDYRRMNVALTRAKKKLIVIGDSTTLGVDPFYKKMFDYLDKIGGYHSVFELMYA